MLREFGRTADYTVIPMASPAQISHVEMLHLCFRILLQRPINQVASFQQRSKLKICGPGASVPKQYCDSVEMHQELSQLNKQHADCNQVALATVEGPHHKIRSVIHQLVQ